MIFFFLEKPESLAKTGNGERGKVEEAVREEEKVKTQFHEPKGYL